MKNRKYARFFLACVVFPTRLESSNYLNIISDSINFGLIRFNIQIIIASFMQSTHFRNKVVLYFFYNEISKSRDSTAQNQGYFVFINRIVCGVSFPSNLPRTSCKVMFEMKWRTNVGM